MTVEALARRSAAVGAGGAVASGSRAAAAVGARALVDGGNAFDAAVAAALTETVALPSKCGLAGDVVALYLPAGAATPVSLVGIGGAARGLADAAAELGWRTPLTGPLSVGVPGAPVGYARLAALGTMPLGRLAAPAVDLARRGIWWSPMNALLERESRDLLRTHQPDGCVFSPADAPHREGDLVALPRLANALEEFVLRGGDLFAGPVGEAVAETVRAKGGPMTVADLCSAEVAERDAHSVETRHGPLWATNAPTYGTVLTAALAGRDPADVGPDDVSRSLAARTVRDLASQSAAGDEGTSTVAAVDRAGNAVVIVHSLSFPQYGSGLVVGEYDLILSNRAGRGFTFAPGDPDGPVAGRRPPTTLHAWALRRDGGWLLGATPGGRQQVPWNVQVIAHLAGAPGGAPEQAMARALTAPRWVLTEGGAEHLEGREMAPLSARSGHTLVHLAPGRCVAGADPRWDGAAVAV